MLYIVYTQRKSLYGKWNGRKDIEFHFLQFLRTLDANAEEYKRRSIELGIKSRENQNFKRK